MMYCSTRHKAKEVTAAQAIVQGLSDDGGLFVPEEFPKISQETLAELSKKDYLERAVAVLSLFLTDFTPEEVEHCVRSAYAEGKFDSKDIAPLCEVSDGAYLLELWHGPTCAFKDMALQLLPYLLTTSMKKVVPGKRIAILVATSGDTGKAALEGFKDVPGTDIMVFYPEDGVSPMQKRQMATQEGNNVAVFAIRGNFDDAQTGVKKIFTDHALAEKLAEQGISFSSANSINWGRLVPQIVYYVSSYCELLRRGDITMGETVNVAVPTGNFGNILAAYYAKQMGVPIGKLICASNRNNVLTDFIRTGTYDRNRDFYTTLSPSMDILISSNLERLLFHLSDEDDAAVRGWFDALSKDGKYTVSDKVKAAIDETFYAGCCDDDETRQTIHNTFAEHHYLCDTHTAVAVKVYDEYRKATGDTTKTLIASTASPYKFSASVLPAVATPESDDEFLQLEQLEKVSGVTAPKQLSTLKNKPVRFTTAVEVDEMPKVVCDYLLK